MFGGSGNARREAQAPAGPTFKRLVIANMPRLNADLIEAGKQIRYGEERLNPSR